LGETEKIQAVSYKEQALSGGRSPKPGGTAKPPGKRGPNRNSMKGS